MATASLMAFVISPDHTVRYKIAIHAGLGRWVGWTRIGGDVSTGLRVVSASNGSSPIRIFASDKSGNLWEDDQIEIAAPSAGIRAITRWPALAVMPADRLVPSRGPQVPSGPRMQAAGPSSGQARHPHHGLRSGHPAETGCRRVRRAG